MTIDPTPLAIAWSMLAAGIALTGIRKWRRQHGPHLAAWVAVTAVALIVACIALAWQWVRGSI